MSAWLWHDTVRHEMQQAERAQEAYADYLRASQARCRFCGEADFACRCDPVEDDAGRALARFRVDEREAVALDFGCAAEDVTDALVREYREIVRGG